MARPGPGETVPRRVPDDPLPEVLPVARGAHGNAGPALVALLVLAAVAVGLVRPWNGPDPHDRVAHATGTPATNAAETTTAPPAPSPALTCAAPPEWRTATIETWGGRQARVWTAAVAVPATGPDDTSIPFQAIVSARVTAIGWCAPVAGVDRPPSASAVTLYQLVDGSAVAIPYERLEPSADDALGELLVPPAQSVGRRPAWAPGRYVIRVASPGGTWTRYMGLEVTAVVPVRVRPGVTAPGG